jgi:hypothetical protein
VEDKPGALARFCDEMRRGEVNLAGVWGFGMGPGRAQILAASFDVDRLRKAVAAGGWKATEGTCFYVTGEDHAGALVDVLDHIAKSGVNLNAVDAVASPGDKFGAIVWVKERDVDEVAKILLA